jgi:ribosome maturation factor RimP
MTMATTRISAPLEGELQALAGQLGCELLHLMFRGGVLRAVLDREPGGVTLQDCEAFSKSASALLDLEDFGRDRYVLEVSSPGLDRELYRARDYERFRGRDVRVTFFEGAERKKRTVVGRLASWDDSSGGLATVIEAGGGEHRIPMADIKVARLVAELP